MESARPYWEAFHLLSRSRGAGGGMTGIPNPIAVSEIVSWATVMGMPVRETVVLVQTLDGAWLDLIATDLKARTERRKEDAKPT